MLLVFDGVLVIGGLSLIAKFLGKPGKDALRFVAVGGGMLLVGALLGLAIFALHITGVRH
jgi:hypothetical protein